MTASHVYVVTHVASGRRYVGKANNPKRRWQAHVSSSRGSKRYFAAALRKYVETAFSFEVIESFDTEDAAYEGEMRWVAFFRSNEPSRGFNLDSGGLGGRKMGPELRAKMDEMWSRKRAATESRIAAEKAGKRVTRERGKRQRLADMVFGEGVVEVVVVAQRGPQDRITRR